MEALAAKGITEEVGLGPCHSWPMCGLLEQFRSYVLLYSYYCIYFCPR